MSGKLLLAKTLVILISGKGGVGKSTTAGFMLKYAKEQGYNAVIMPFAYGVKSVARSMGWDGVKDGKGRQLLISVGMAGREYDEATWARMSFENILPCIPQAPFDLVFVDDWRFGNEGKYVESLPSYQVKKMRVLAPNREILKGTKFYTDPSENSLPDICDMYDLIIDNNLITLSELNTIAIESLELLLKYSEKF
jgi:hypothetical protein